MARGTDPETGFTGDNEPVDVGAVRRDDALIDAIAAGGTVPTDTREQYELALLLTGWRNSIVSEPLPAGPTVDEALAAIEGPKPARLRLLRPIAGAAAAIAVVLGGATILSYDAEPGDPLWSVKSVVFSTQADSTVAKMDTRSQLEQAERLIAEGNDEAARSVLATAAERASGVRDSGQRNELEDWRGRLTAALESVISSVTQPPPPPAGQVPPPVPGPVDPGPGVGVPPPVQPVPPVQTEEPVVPDVDIMKQTTPPPTAPPTSTSKPKPTSTTAPPTPSTTPSG
ncbi:MAG: type IV secretion protein Rhs [Rhodococcus sp.]|nr:type IV secretion protein Rhs [Rhodococcus sp. (in: high G+C Gram-positive bacteria)]